MPDNILYRAAAIAKRKTHNAKAGWSALGEACGVYYGTVALWAEQGRLPWPCLMGWQDYHLRIAEAIDHEISAEDILAESRVAWREQIEKKKAPKK